MGHLLTIDQNRKFALLSIDEFHFDAGFLLQRSRQTGGLRASAASDWALSDRYLLHGSSFFCMSHRSERISLAEGSEKMRRTLHRG
jgi:hypothetical protein